MANDQHHVYIVAVIIQILENIEQGLPVRVLLRPLLFSVRYIWLDAASAEGYLYMNSTSISRGESPTSS